MLYTILFLLLLLLFNGILGFFISNKKYGSQLSYNISLLSAVGILFGVLGSFIFIGWNNCQTATIPIGIPWLGLYIKLDALAAFFLIVINLGAIFSSFYALNYGEHEKNRSRVLPFYPMFLSMMNLCVLSHDAISFVFAWELMSIFSWFLVTSNYQEKENIKAGYIYIIMASVGGLFLISAFALLSNGFAMPNFDTIRMMPKTDIIVIATVLLTLIGSGSKAGLVPMHIWLPRAHPVAPSHISALLSGVMTKVAVYAFIRIVFDLLDLSNFWGLGTIVMIIGSVSALLGVMLAVVEDNFKKMLAYSTIENIGIIFIAIGLAMIFKSFNINYAFALVLAGAFLHIFNHSLFKTTLFLCSGSVLLKTHHKNMNDLGGLIKFMPLTAMAFLCSAMAISALPPFNGFVSEWMLFQSIIAGSAIPNWLLKFLIPAIGAVVALTAGLVAATFVKAFGMVFLGNQRAEYKEPIKENDYYMQGAVLTIATLCLIIGIIPGVFSKLFAPAVKLLTKYDWHTDIILFTPSSYSLSSYSGVLIVSFVIIMAILATFIVHGLACKHTRITNVWDCGHKESSPAFQYTASSFSQPIRRSLATNLLGAKEKVIMPNVLDLEASQFHTEVNDYSLEYIYNPLKNLILRVAKKTNTHKLLSIRGYLSVMFMLLIFFLIVVALWN